MGRSKILENNLLELTPKILTEFQKLNSVKNIAKKFNIKRGTVYYILMKNRVIVPKGIGIERKLLTHLYKEYKKGFSLEILAKKYNIDKTKLCRILNSYNLSEPKKEMIILLRKGGYSYSIIAQRLSITTDIVKQILKDFKGTKILEKVGLTKKEIIEIRQKLETKNSGGN